jgi:hypothetical protein
VGGSRPDETAGRGYKSQGISGMITGPVKGALGSAASESRDDGLDDGNGVANRPQARKGEADKSARRFDGSKWSTIVQEPPNPPTQPSLTHGPGAGLLRGGATE